jgi:outer membrane protein TolC
VQILNTYHRRLLAAALFSVLIGPAPLSAATVAEAVQTTLERDPQYPIHLATRAVGEGYRQQAGALLGGDPSLSLLAKSDQLVGTDNGYQEYEAALSMPLWMPGQRGARQAIGDRLDQQASSELQLRSWEVAGDVLQAAWDLRLAEAAQQQAQRQWDSAKTLQRDISRRVRAGELARADRLLAEQETLAREADFDDAAAEVEQARLSWRSLTGLDELPIDLERPPALVTAASPTHPRLIAAMDGVGTAQAVRNDTSKNRRARPVLTI